MTMQIFIETEQWGRLDITEQVSSWNFDSRDGVGWGTASATLDGPLIEQWPFLEHQAEDVLEFFSDEVVWSGKLAGAELDQNGGLTLLAEGVGLRLRDVGVWRSFSDASVQWWTPQAGNPPSGFEADNNNRVYVGASGEGFAAGAEYAMVYPETGVDLGAEIARLFATVLFEIAAGDWIAEIRQADGTVLWTASTSMVQAYQLFLDTPTGGTFKLGDGDGIETGALAYNASAAAIETALRSAYSDAGITVVADADFLITFPTGNAGNFQITDDALTYATTGAATCTQQAVDGVELDLAVADTGLVLALRKGSAGAGTAYVRLTGVVVQTLANATNSQVAEEILDTAELAGGAITESDLLANRAVWQKESRLQALQDMAQLGDGEVSWLFAVYEAPQFGPWPTEANWELRRDDLSRWKVTWRRDAVRNAVRARLSDGWMSDWLEDADSIARWGRREEVLELGDTTQAEALSLAQVYLVEKAEALAGLSLESDAYCRTPDGAIHSGYLMRAGDLVRLRDLIPDQDLLIRVAETRATAAGVEVIPAGQDDRLETILAVQEQQLQKAATQALAASGGGGGSGGGTTGEDHDPVTLGVGSAAELTLSGQVLTLAEVLTPGEHTAIGDSSPHHAAVTLNAAADTLLSLSGQQLGVDAQAANMVYAGPASGVAATPTFRALGASDLALALDELTDVDADTPGDGEVLAWDADSGKWVPAAAGAGDMLKASYDTDDDGVVDEAAAVEGVVTAGNSKYYGTNGLGAAGFYDLPAGGGDMLKATYDTDDDGVVDEATAVEGVAAAGNSKYYGTDGSGNPGFHDVPEEMPAPVARGDMLTAQGETPAWAPLTLGAEGEFVGSDGTDVAWRAANSSNGYVNREDSVIGMDGNYFEIAPAVDEYVIYSDGKRMVKDAAESIEITNDLTQHYVYFDSDGVLRVSTTLWDIYSANVLTAIVYKDGATYAILDERHGYRRNRAWHAWAHVTIGARYGSGLAGTFGNTTFSIAQGSIYDEDLLEDTGGTLTACRLWYRNSGATAMRFESGVAYPWKLGGTPAPQYDNAGTLTDVDANRYFCSYVYCTNDVDYPIYIVVGQAQYTTVAAARNDSLPATPGQVTKEWKLLYRVIYQRSGGSATYVESMDFREVSTGPGSSYTPASHTNLTNRDAASSHPASAIAADTTNFDGLLSAADSTVQAALETLDALTLPVGDMTKATYDVDDDGVVDEAAAVEGAAAAGNSKYYGTDGSGNVGFYDLPAVVRQTVLTFAGALAVTDNPLRIYNQFGVAQTISKVFLAVGTAPTGASVIVDVHQDGTTIFTDQGNRPTITAGNATGETTSIDVATWTAGSYLTVHIDQIGSTVAGSDLVVHIIHS